jgi:hypothetical protein
MQVQFLHPSPTTSVHATLGISPTSCSRLFVTGEVTEEEYHRS